MEETKKETNGYCKTICGKWCCDGKGYIWARWILGILIFVVVFSLGVKLGEVKSALYGYGHGIRCGTYRNAHPMMFYRQNEGMFNKNFGPEMMRGQDRQYQQQIPDSINTPTQ